MELRNLALRNSHSGRTDSYSLGTMKLSSLTQALGSLLACTVLELISAPTLAAEHLGEDVRASGSASMQAAEAEAEQVQAEAPKFYSIISPHLNMGPEPPEIRCMRDLWIPHSGIEGMPDDFHRTEEQARALAERVLDLARSGRDFVQLIREYSGAKSARFGGSMGVFPPGMLQKSVEDFLFSAELGEVSQVFDDLSEGFHILQRVEARAACRVIQIRGVEREQEDFARQLLKQLSEGADFATLAREHSADARSAALGGAWRIYERGTQDRLVKAAAFDNPLGGLSLHKGASSYYIVKRVEIDSIDPSVAEQNFIRLRSIFLSWDEAALGLIPNPRTIDECEILANELVRRITEGEDMGELARQFNDDPTGRERAGDLGWLHRRQPKLPAWMNKSFQLQVGELAQPIPLKGGWVILRREG